MIYRTEHPNPQWERAAWQNLNGEWEFDFDFGVTAVERELYLAPSLPKTIQVPFCPESELSGIGYKDFIPGVVYRKVISLSAKQLAGRVFLHFGAVDFEATLFVNGKKVMTHIGGYSSFKADITAYAVEGENVIFLAVKDDTRSITQPSGKQSDLYASHGCSYTRTTGIWQTVWMEITPKAYIKDAKYYPDIENNRLTILGKVEGNGTVSAKASFEGRLMGGATAKTAGGQFALQISLAERHLWEVGVGNLYDLELTFGDDVVKSYFGLRSVELSGNKFLFNGKSLFLRMVLDQGFYPDGIYTAKTDEDLKRDVELSMACGFNGARLHQKVFEKRFLYHCDKAGYLVWGAHGTWGMSYTDPVAVENFLCEWLEVLDRDFNSPAVIGWCPVNETWGYHELTSQHRALESFYRATKAADPTRPCIAASGNYHIAGMEIYDVHDYDPDFTRFSTNYAKISEGIVNDQIRRNEGDVQPFTVGMPVFVSEYGGFRWIEEGEDAGWGYGDAPKSKEELLERYKNYTDVLLDNPDIMGLCYTQLYDVEQEKNGLYTYGRKPKLDMDKVKAITSRKAKIEE